MISHHGRFITFEGCDGSGKTTQMRLVADRLRGKGYDVVETQEPGGTEIGIRIRDILLDPLNKRLCPVAEMLLYFAARAQNFDELILPAWQKGAIVLSDRFTDSTLAYQGEGRNLGADVVMRLHDIACHGVQPDLTIFLDLDVRTGLERTRNRNGKGPDRMDDQSLEFHCKVREAYLRLAAENPNRIKLLDGSGSTTDVSERVWNVVQPILPHAVVPAHG